MAGDKDQAAAHEQRNMLHPLAAIHRDLDVTPRDVRGCLVAVVDQLSEELLLQTSSTRPTWLSKSGDFHEHPVGYRLLLEDTSMNPGPMRLPRHGRKNACGGQRGRSGRAQALAEAAHARAALAEREAEREAEKGAMRDADRDAEGGAEIATAHVATGGQSDVAARENEALQARAGALEEEKAAP
eukprot:1232814-Prymnesium_polylepis.2